ncbi:MAG: VanW family protein [Christensenellales bacterium]
MFEKLKGNKPVKIIIGATLGVLVLALVVVGVLYMTGSTPVVASDIIFDDGTFYSGVELAGIDLGDLTFEEGKEKVTMEAENRIAALNLTLTLGENTNAVSARDIRLSYDVEDKLQEAFLLGRVGSFSERSAAIAKAKNEGIKLELEKVFDDVALASKAAELAEQLTIEAKDATVEMNPNASASERFTFIEEVPGNKVEAEQLKGFIKQKFEEGAQGSFEVPHTASEPAVKVADLKQNLKLRASYTTKYNSGSQKNPNRVYNIKKCADLLSGAVLQPGEELSINERVGPRRSPEWKSAPGITDGKYVDQPGGGVCQVSTTLYNAILYADLEIVRRQNHSWPIGYIDLGYDATISTGGPDLIFKNNTNSVLYVIAYANTSKYTITVEMWGEELPWGPVKYERRTSVTSTKSPPSPKIIETASLAPGKTQWGEKKPRSGQTVSSTLIFKDSSGKEVHRRTWTSSYRTIQGELYVGVGSIVDSNGNVSAPATPTPPPTTPTPPPTTPTPPPTTPTPPPTTPTPPPDSGGSDAPDGGAEG